MVAAQWWGDRRAHSSKSWSYMSTSQRQPFAARRTRVELESVYLIIYRYVALEVEYSLLLIRVLVFVYTRHFICPTPPMTYMVYGEPGGK